MPITEISAQDFSHIVRNGGQPDVLDVRTDVECRAEKLGCHCIHTPLHELNAADFAHKNRGRLDNKPLYILCRSGGRARKAAESLQKAGLDNLVIVQGGLSACAVCNAPIEKGKVWSLERQVRFTAGILVLVGVLLGHFFHPDFYILSGFVGAGLIFAGITDWCGMAMLLARAPWNNVDSNKEIQKSIQSFERKETM